MNDSRQFPLAFSFQDAFHFDTFRDHGANEAVVHLLRHFTQSNVRFCFVWGRAGSGKTHLMQALCHDNDAAVYLPMEALLPLGPESLRGMELYDCVVIDDVDRLAGDRAWEEALFYLFNALAERGSKLCMTARCSPAAMALVLADLKSRLQSAVIYELVPPDDSIKARVLAERADARGIALSSEVCDYILSRSPRSMHDLLALLDNLDTLSLAQKRRVTVPFLKEAFGW